jgi:hypothetical protein
MFPAFLRTVLACRKLEFRLTVSAIINIGRGETTSGKIVVKLIDFLWVDRGFSIKSHIICIKELLSKRKAGRKLKGSAYRTPNST